jgi:glutathione peroxidase-family protein
VFAVFCPQFGAQEPGSNSDIKSFAKKNYGVTFPLMSKVDVNGQGGTTHVLWLLGVGWLSVLTLECGLHV